MLRLAFYLGILAFVVLASVGIGLISVYSDKIPMSLKEEETFNPQTGRKYSPSELSDVLNKKQYASEAFRLTITGAICFGAAMALFIIGSFIIFYIYPRYCQPAETVHAGQVAPEPTPRPLLVMREPAPLSEPTSVGSIGITQVIPSGATAPLPTHSPSTIDVLQPTSASSPHVTFQIGQPPPPLAQNSLV